MKNKLVKLLVAAVFATVTLVVLSISSLAVSLNEGYYYICPSDDISYAIDVCGGSGAEMTYTQLYKRSYNNPAQIFEIKKLSNGWYTIKSKGSGLCLNVEGGSNNNGTRLWMYRDDGTAACHFKFEDCGNGNYRIINRIGNKVIDLDNNRRFNGSRIHMWQSHYGASAKWKFVPHIVDGGVYELEFRNTGVGLNVQFRPQNGIGNIVQDRLNGEDNERWVARYNSRYDAFYFTPLYRSDAALNALYGSAATKGRQVIIHPSNINDTASLWRMEYLNGYVRFRNVAASSLYIDVDSGRTAAGTRINLWTSSAYNQSFTLKLVYDIGVWPVGGNGGTDKNNWPRYSNGSYHSGTDISAPVGTPVLASHSGVVERVKDLGGSSYGKYIIIKSTVKGKTVYIYYAHLNSFAVSVNQTVCAGQQIGTVGSTGNSTGPHLHYEVRNSNMDYGSLSKPTLNPYDYITRR
ncbi:MAG: RICIN domain-containing protein [Clostridia bacterium]|nr:RICIN domain-containing protein [Clostridia bacterium]